MCAVPAPVQAVETPLLLPALRERECSKSLGSIHATSQRKRKKRCGAALRSPRPRIAQLWPRSYASIAT